jgi:hypothetical protein
MRGLSEFVMARAADDEELARQYGDPGRLSSGLVWATDVNRRMLEVDPSRVVAECEAKRRIAAELVDAVSSYEGKLGPEGEVTRLSFVLRALALPYADHPDYQPEWRI